MECISKHKVTLMTVLVVRVLKDKSKVGGDF